MPFLWSCFPYTENTQAGYTGLKIDLGIDHDEQIAIGHASFDPFGGFPDRVG